MDMECFGVLKNMCGALLAREPFQLQLFDLE